MAKQKSEMVNKIDDAAVKSAQDQQKADEQALAKRNFISNLLGQQTEDSELKYIEDAASPSGYKAVKSKTGQAKTLSDLAKAGQIRSLQDVLNFKTDVDGEGTFNKRREATGRGLADVAANDVAREQSRLEAAGIPVNSKEGQRALRRVSEANAQKQSSADVDAYNLSLADKSQALQNKGAEQGLLTNKLAAAKGIDTPDTVIGNNPQYNESTSVDKSGQLLQQGQINANIVKQNNEAANADRKANDVLGAIGSVVKTGADAYGAVKSDVNIKENEGKKEPSLNPKKDEQLKGATEMVDKMPVQKWEYKEGTEADDGGKEHIGTMAQNFKEATGVGDGKEIDIASYLGVLTKAVQELNDRLSAKGGGKNG